MKTTKIKLLKLDSLEDGTIRLQSQLLVGKDSADFILKDGVLKWWSNGEQGFKFYETSRPYEIVETSAEMARQQL